MLGCRQVPQSMAREPVSITEEENMGMKTGTGSSRDTKNLSGSGLTLFVLFHHHSIKKSRIKIDLQDQWAVRQGGSGLHPSALRFWQPEHPGRAWQHQQ